MYMCARMNFYKHPLCVMCQALLWVNKDSYLVEL